MRAGWQGMLAVILASAVCADETPAPCARVPWKGSRLVGSPDPPLPYTVERVFAGLDLKTPIYIAEEPGANFLTVVLHQEGDKPARIVRFANEPNVAAAEPFFESPQRIVYSLCFDPRYGANRRAYVFTNGPTPETERTNRISRYRVTSGERPHIDPATEEVILEWRSAGHDGGDMAFGLDGMLYITTGDGTSDSDTWNTGQTLDDLLGAVLRIDVSAGDAPYCTPPDNPFVDLAGARGEIWAYGLRNPWRMCVDPRSGRLWVGTNGQDLWETAHLVRRGENYGWSVYEGNHPFYLERRRGPTPLVPSTIEHSHAEFRSLTGGVVYYGQQLRDLEGVYVYGDYSSGRIWGMKHDGQRPLWHRELADTSLMIAGFRAVPGGDLLVADHGGGIYRLVPAPTAERAAPFPTALSETGLFADTAEHRPAEGVIAYAVNVPGWVDGATAERFIAVPGTAQVEFADEQSWNFPDGTALVQTLMMERTAGDAAAPLRVETRVLLRQQQEWSAYTYRWNAAQDDALLVPKEGAEVELLLGDSAAGAPPRTWRFPSRVECLTCHSRAANFVLGLRTAQLDRAGGDGANQLAALAQRGLFSAPLPERAEPAQPLADPYDPALGLERRARSYLEVNCAGCHVAAGGGNSQMELSLSTEPDKMRLIEARPQHDTFGITNAMLVAPGDPDRSVLVHRLAHRGRGQMPPLVSTRVDDRAVELFRAWIATLTPKRPIVRRWQTADLLPALDALGAGRSAADGKGAFREIGCAECHRRGSEGGTVGPDLSDVARRLTAPQLLEAILEPSRHVADEYSSWLVQLDDGQVVAGRIEREDERVVVLRQSSATSPPIEIAKAAIVERRKSATSNMPEGTLDVLHEHEVLDLLTYLIGSEEP